MVPTFATHYHLESRAPFLNLSDLDAETLDQVMRNLNEEHAAGLSHRTFGPHYMELRRRTEAALRAGFANRGGRLRRANPHYFVLGESAWFAALSPNMRSVSVALSDLPPESTSVTYPDSVVAMRCGSDFGLPELDRPYVGRVFLLSELDELIAAHGMPADHPDDDYVGYEFREFEKFVEIQVWSDEPIQQFLSARCPKAPDSLQ